jgi:hypothetical protein
MSNAQSIRRSAEARVNPRTWTAASVFRSKPVFRSKRGRTHGDRGLPHVVHVTEGWATKDAHAANFAKEESKALVAKLAQLVTGDAQYQDEVPVGGIFRAARETPALQPQAD